MNNKNTFFASKNLTAGYFAVLFAAVALYVISCAPGALWQDSGMYQYRIRWKVVN